MSTAIQMKNGGHALTDVRAIADGAFSRAAGAPLIGGNSVRLLKNASENYPAWLDAVGAAFTNRRVLDPVEARLMTSVGALFLILAALFALFPHVLVYPLLIIFGWLGAALLYRSYKLHREAKRKRDALASHRRSKG